jgi:FkbM family methyltransferase
MKKVLKLIYQSIPFKKQMFIFLKKIWTPKESLYMHLHFKESFEVPVSSDKNFKIYNTTSIENEIFWEGLNGKWEKESLKLWQKLCLDANCIFDIGANTGVYSLVAKTINPSAKVFAFEPHPLFFDMLEQNIKINSFDIASYKKAISNIDGDLVIEDYSGAIPVINVSATTLDTFILENQLKAVDLLKIDVETHEPEVIKGFLKNLSLHKPTLLIEVLNEEIAKFLNDTFVDMEYLYFNIDEKGLVVQTPKVEKSFHFNYLICKKEVALKIGLI